VTYRRKSPGAFVDQLKSVLSASAAGSIELAGRLNALVKEAALALNASKDRPPPDSSELLSRMLDFQLAAYAVVTEHSLAILNGLITSAEQTLLDASESAAAVAQQAPQPQGTQASSRIARRPTEATGIVQVVGRQDETLTCPFLVENQYDRGLDVSFEADPLVPGKGPPLPASLISFEPARLVLPPRGQAVARAHIRLIRDFTAGETYSTAVHVLGFRCPPVQVAITVAAPKKAARQRTSPSSPVRTSPPEPVKLSEPVRLGRARALGGCLLPSRATRSACQLTVQGPLRPTYRGISR